jgi:hypothetical protein
MGGGHHAPATTVDPGAVSMADIKTKRNKKSVPGFLAGIKHNRRRADAQILLKLMQQASGARPEMWGDSIVGFGRYHYKYASGREGDTFLTGFSPRVQSMTVYIMPGFDRYKALLRKLGKHTTGKSCLYINKLDDVDLPTLKTLISESVKAMKKTGRWCGARGRPQRGTAGVPL